VDVVGHQAIGPDLNPCPARGIGQQIEVQFVVAILEEGLLAAVAALRHMMRDAGQYDAGKARHEWRLSQRDVTRKR
jgi:hypothetical protein